MSNGYEFVIALGISKKVVAIGEPANQSVNDVKSAAYYFEQMEYDGQHIQLHFKNLFMAIWRDNSNFESKMDNLLDFAKNSSYIFKRLFCQTGDNPSDIMELFKRILSSIFYIN